MFPTVVIRGAGATESSDLFLDAFCLILVELVPKILQGLPGVTGGRVGTAGTLVSITSPRITATVRN
jgi:hypothetical protein